MDFVMSVPVNTRPGSEFDIQLTEPALHLKNINEHMYTIVLTQARRIESQSFLRCATLPLLCVQRGSRPEL